MFFCITSLSSTNRHQLTWQIVETDVVKLTHGVNNILYKTVSDTMARNELSDKWLSQKPRNWSLEFLIVLNKSFKRVLTEAPDSLMYSVIQEQALPMPCNKMGCLYLRGCSKAAGELLLPWLVLEQLVLQQEDRSWFMWNGTLITWLINLLYKLTAIWFGFKAKSLIPQSNSLCYVCRTGELSVLSLPVS